MMIIVVKIMIDYYNIDIDGNDGKNYKKNYENKEYDATIIMTRMMKIIIIIVKMKRMIMITDLIVYSESLAESYDEHWRGLLVDRLVLQVDVVDQLDGLRKCMNDF